MKMMKMASARSVIASAFALAVLAARLHVVTSEIVELSLILDADSTTVHYVQGYISAPGHVDLSDLKFVSTEEPAFIHGEDDDMFEEENDDSMTNSTMNDDNTPGGSATDVPKPAPTSKSVVPQPAPTSKPARNKPVPTAKPVPKPARTSKPVVPQPAPTSKPALNRPAATTAPTPIGGNGRNRTRFLLDGDDDGNGNGDEDGATDDNNIEDSVVNIVMFRLPDACANSPGGCDWATLGVGAPDETVEGGITYCCTEDAASRKLCRPKLIGQLILNSNFQGEQRQLEIPAQGDFIMAVEPQSQFEEGHNGNYALVLANCNDNGREILVLGSMEWMSEHGFLPGDLLGLLYFYSGLAGVYLFLVIMYWCGMKMYQDSSIPIQQYILTTLVLGFLESFLLTMDLYVLNDRGNRLEVVVYAGIFIGVVKRALFRCLGVMVAMGWGVIRDSLGMALARITFLGALYCGLTAARDLFTIVAVAQVKRMSTNHEDELIDLVMILSVAIIAINFIFYCWIMNNMSATTAYLQNMNQTSKLRRHLRLRCIIWVSLGYSVAWLLLNVFGFPNLAVEWAWVLEASMHANYVFVLAGVSILWRPNSNAKDYALQMELPALGGDDDDENELELTASSVPSAGEYDGNDPDHPYGMKIDGATMS